MLQLTQRFPLKRAFVTGAASGLGLEICKLFARDGWTIGMADINQNPLTEAASAMKKLGGSPMPYPLDVSDKAAYAEVARQFLATAGGIDVLVNNAGVGDYGRVDTYGLDNWDWLIGINLMGVIYGCALFVPTLRQQGHGAVLNVASAAAFSSLPRMAAYNVSKAGVRSLSESLDGEVRPYGITVSVLMPTFFKTHIMQHGRNRVEDPVSRYVFGSTKLLPDKVARVFLDQAAKGKFATVLPFDAKLMYLLRRLSPTLAQWVCRMAEKKQERVAETLRKRYERRKKAGKVDEAYVEGLFGKE